MKKFIYKSKLLIIIYVTVTIILLMSINVYNKAKEEGYKETTFLSNNYVKIETYNNKTISGIVEKSLEYPKDSIFMLNLGYGIEAVGYSNAELFDIKLKSGRKFSYSDFVDKTNSVIVSESVYEACEVIDGVKKYYYGEKYYDVIGVIDENTYDYENSRIKIYLNIYAEDVIHNYSYLVWDAGKNSEQFIDELVDEYSTKIVSFGTDEYKKDSNMIMSGASVIVVFGIMAVMVLINVTEATKIWFDGRKKEFSLRMLLGESKRKAIFWVKKEYSVTVIASIMLGNILAVIFVLVFTRYKILGSAMRLLKPDMELIEILTVDVIVFVIGYLACILLLWKNLKKGAIRILK